MAHLAPQHFALKKPHATTRPAPVRRCPKCRLRTASPGQGPCPPCHAK